MIVTNLVKVVKENSFSNFLDKYFVQINFIAVFRESVWILIFLTLRIKVFISPEAIDAHNHIK